MIVSRAHPSSISELFALVKTMTEGSQSIVIQAGHFLLYYDNVEDQLLPCISSELTSPRHESLRHEAGEFPLFTWQLGLELLDSLSAKFRHAMVVVNDWQYIPKHVDRRRFYENYRKLPCAYVKVLENYKNELKLLEPLQNTGTRPFFGEMNLRNQYKKSIERLITERRLPPEAILIQSDDGLKCSLPDAVGREREVYCSNKTGDCTAEIAQMLSLAVQQVGCDCFINLYPAVCRDFVEQGTELGNDLLNNGLTNVLNIGFPTHGIECPEDLLRSCEVTWHRFSSNSSAPHSCG